MLKSKPIQFIDIKRQYQSYKTVIDAAIQKVLDEGSFILGPEVAALEEQLADYIGVKHCITVSSGTDSLLIALMALGIKPGDEVITVPFTWISTAEVIQLLGATPVFVDIDPITYNMDPTLLEKAITPKTKAIIPVSLFGHMADLIIINAIASRYKLAVIEDSAQSFGASYHNKRSLSMTTIGTTSFFPAKTFGCYGDGGAIFTNDDDLNDIMRSIRVHGGIQRNKHDHLGINGRFDTIQAAILLAKWPYFKDELQARLAIGKRYNMALKTFLDVPIAKMAYTHIYGQYTIRTTRRESLMKLLSDNDIPHAIYYPKCLHEQPVFQYLNYTYGTFPEAERASKEVLSLPMHPWLSQKEQETIIEVITSNF